MSPVFGVICECAKHSVLMQLGELVPGEHSHSVSVPDWEAVPCEPPQDDCAVSADSSARDDSFLSLALESSDSS
jgi:hypothetical protein